MTANTRALALLAAAGSLALLGGAFLFQAMGYAPCKLCLWQRWPHAAAIVIGGVVVLTGWRGLSWAGALAALTTAVIGIYHSGVERGIFAGPDTCTSNGIGGLTPEELMGQILNAPLIRCDEVAWSLLGLSMASWNAILSLILAGIWVAAARRA
jgi:disulfide bond formation protein DsbB